MVKAFLLASAAIVATASSANAAAILTGATVTGPSGTVWNTTADSFYTLFLQSPGLGNYLNPNDEAINATLANGPNRFLLAGEGFRPGENGDSDAIYTLTLNFDGGRSLTGTYTPLTNTFVGGSSFLDGSDRYSLREFSFRRFLGDAVSPYVATPGGDTNDYVGSFNINVSAVPEPATWGLMILGFGAIGGAMRRRKAQASVRFA